MFKLEELMFIMGVQLVYLVTGTIRTVKEIESLIEVKYLLVGKFFKTSSPV
jgi:thiamine monophosphate synthase